MASTIDFRTHVDQSCRYSEEFVNIYYDCMDKKRRNLTRLYLDKATLVWNGNNVSGQDALGEFFESLPSSEFQVHTLDCQPVHVFIAYTSVMWKIMSLTDNLERTRPTLTDGNRHR
ncbi:NTF2-related export protein 2 isoform X2 [Ictalurus punctatus]|uniref:NTF2-related export protein 2 isoform X2 n=1 Tax=Ictalurus punctatus TaxID=7998 RepID=A0A979EZC3_ICTPU|nr:NTF2-related export protein 2 isoform X2 [Ictalurus punctatus]